MKVTSKRSPAELDEIAVRANRLLMNSLSPRLAVGGVADGLRVRFCDLVAAAELSDDLQIEQNRKFPTKLGAWWISQVGRLVCGRCRLPACRKLRWCVRCQKVV